MYRSMAVVSFISALLIGGIARAVDQTIPAKVGIVKPGKLAKLVSKNPAGYTLPTPGGSDDPVLHGAQIRFVDMGVLAGAVTFNLDKTGWAGLGNPPGSAGYKYTGIGATPPDSTCSTVLIKSKVIKAICKGSAVTLTPPFGGDDAVILGVPSVSEGAALRYCAELGGQPSKNIPQIFKRLNASPPTACPDIVYHTCNLAPATSRFRFFVAALPTALDFSVSGTLEIGSEIGGTAMDCRVTNISPVVIPSIGVICAGAFPGCPVGSRYCGPGAPGSGPPLGVDVASDGNIGSCSSNVTCQTACQAACPAGATATGNCTGYCTGSAPVDQVCTTDANCLPANGSCQGPDPIGGSAHVCQCTCTNTAAHGGSDPGDGQCFLGLSGGLEASAPCDGTDVLIGFSSGCLPATNQRASAHIVDANFTPGAMVPPGSLVNDGTGTSLACSTFDSGALSGLTAVGVGNAWGSALGDVSIGLQSTCQ